MDKGPNDLEEQIDKLKKQVVFLQSKCRQAGKAILDLEVENGGLKKDIDRLVEENSNFEILLKKWSVARDSKHIKGDRAELIAQEFFIKKGFYVFNNISQHGPVDIVIMDKDGHVMLIDVKALSLRTKNGWKVNRIPTKEQAKLGVHLVFVDLETGNVMEDVPTRKNYKNNVINIKEYMEIFTPEWLDG